jgi:hypothetical protein
VKHFPFNVVLFSEKTISKKARQLLKQKTKERFQKEASHDGDTAFPQRFQGRIEGSASRI